MGARKCWFHPQRHVQDRPRRLDVHHCQLLRRHPGGHFQRYAFPAARCVQAPPSVTRSRQLISMGTTKLKANGRHDPCVVPRPIPIMETMTALVLADIAYVSDPRGAQESHPQLPKEIRFCFCDATIKARCCETACSRGCPHRRSDRRLSRRRRRRQRRSLLPFH